MNRRCLQCLGNSRKAPRLAKPTRPWLGHAVTRDNYPAVSRPPLGWHSDASSAATPTVETLSVNSRPQTKALVTVISNARWKDREGEVREKATAITWTL
jgi:hypothetical protein